MPICKIVWSGVGWVPMLARQFAPDVGRVQLTFSPFACHSPHPGRVTRVIGWKSDSDSAVEGIWSTGQGGWGLGGSNQNPNVNGGDWGFLTQHSTLMIDESSQKTTVQAWALYLSGLCDCT